MAGAFMTPASHATCMAAMQAKADGYSPVLLHHADWLASLLTDRRDTSDWNNTLKLGYDPEAEQWPPWLISQVSSRFLIPGDNVCLSEQKSMNKNQKYEQNLAT